MASRTSYEVRVAGVIATNPTIERLTWNQVEDWYFDDLTIRVEPSATVLAGSLDQAALHGLIERIKALGLELIDITRVPTGRSTSARSTRHPAE